MTVLSQTNKMAPQAMNGVAVTFSFTFRALVDDPEAIKASIVDTTTDVQTDLVYNGGGADGYTVSIDTDGIGGSITVNDARSADYTITIYREYEETQESNYADYNAFPAETAETNYDKLTMIDQQQTEIIGRTLTLPITVTGVDVTLPVPEADAAIGWNATADALVNNPANVNQVAVDSTATADFLGALPTDGVLRVNDSNITYTDGGDFITLDTIQDIGVADSPTFNNLTLTSLTMTQAVTIILDEDDLVSDRDDALATQQSIKAYVDSQVGGIDEFIELTDTPAAYATNAGRFLFVNAGATAVEFATNFYYETATGQISVGSAAPLGNHDISINDAGSASTTDQARLGITTYSTNTNYDAQIYLRKSANDTIDTATQTAANDQFGGIYFQGMNTTPAFAVGASILAYQTGASGATFVPTALELVTYSDTAVNTDQLVLTSTNRIGIGRDDPVWDVEVARSAVGAVSGVSSWSSTSTDAPAVGFIKSSSDTIGTYQETVDTERLGFIIWTGCDNTNTLRNAARIDVYQDGAATGTRVPTNMFLETYSGTTLNANQLVLHNDGLIGVGIDTPVNRLHLHSTTSGANAMRFTNVTTGITSGDGFQVGINTAEQAILWNLENTDMLFATNGLERFRINAAGAVTFNNAFTFPTTDGAATQYLQTDGLGNVTWVSFVGLADPMTTRGDIIIRDATNTTARLGVGAASQVITTDGTDVFWGAGAGSPAGADTQIQYNDTGAFGASANFLYDNATDQFVIGSPTFDDEFRIVALAGSTQVNIDTYSATPANSPRVFLRTSEQNTEGLTATTDGQNLGFFAWQGVNTTPSFDYGAYIQCIQNGAATASSVPTDLEFAAYDGTSTNCIIRMDGPNGYIGLHDTSPDFMLDCLWTGRGSAGVINIETSDNTDNSRGSYLILRRNNNNTGTLVATAQNQWHGEISFYGVNTGPAYRRSARMYVQQQAASGATLVPTDIRFETTAASRTVRFIINDYSNSGSHDSISIGDGATTLDKTIFARNGDTNEPYLSYDESANEWVFSNDGTTTAAIGSGGGATRGTFTNASLTAGVLTITHNLGLTAPYPVIVVIFDNNNDQIIPDDVTGATNSVDVDLSSYGTLTGTWGYAYN